ncbi:MAG: ammonium transporter [Spirochaetes bacterium GWD1_61_31]|nr:MAG: ammonium transporter [Spirochaetes bacterium GWB1_60_80]OHD33751.1 MAG: ammonium transporter [Spirochaetes bacterium GWC1_61_12]OHD38974.1 MAG: ammonium transporter [Spirochaetes bacterium GWD1_61_31]OHD43424.1 MAG: ammonium transporter [Spirochaetes bacterium GWE1_60_18]OHD58955.1 MAG: ammonium transporter [Spirochaetes bacterium GWF1_60_12]HAP42636.1 ammonium transporter [Spirochaetaceae bacterium]
MNIDIGSTGFMLLATSLVMFMTPGLAFFYGGLVGRKNVLTIMFQSFVSLGVTTILWFLFGYSLCFSGTLGHGDLGGIIGNLDMAFLRGVDLNGVSPVNPGVPLLVFVAYQMMFAIITPALITGAFANRIRFPAYLLFLVAWLVLVYFPFVHMIWGGGILASWGVRDFAGGIVVHTTAGFAALASVLYVGKRRSVDKGLHSLPLVALGTAILWFGWYGFNAGSEFGVDRITALAFLNTDVAASFAGPTWLLLDWIFTRKPKFLGFLTGAVAGLATITPCAGYVSTSAAVVIGILASLICYLAVHLKNKAGLDDALDVFGVHGVGGLTGSILLGVFATATMTFPGRDPALLTSGLLEGNVRFFLVQLVAVAIAAAYAFLFTLAMLWLINKVTPVRVSALVEQTGLDEGEHGETAYI